MSTVFERPGVYTSYEVSGTQYSGQAGGVVGLAALAEKGDSGTVYEITADTQAQTAFGAASPITELVRLMLLNGVAEIRAVPLQAAQDSTVPAAADYTGAFQLLTARADVELIVCDSADAAVHTALKTAIMTAGQRCAHKIGVVESGAETAAAMVSAAQTINCERIVVAAPAALTADGKTAVTGSLAAALAGAIVSEKDPAIPLNGAELYGLGGVSMDFTDGEINTLVRGGVTPVECVGSTVSAVRGITSKTQDSAGEPYYTYRELTTVRIIDDVIPDVRDKLRANFTRTKNTAQTRGAIRTQVIIELEKKLAAQIIESYGNVTVEADADDPTVCLVTFEFTVAHGLNQIRITANITV